MPCVRLRSELRLDSLTKTHVWDQHRKRPLFEQHVGPEAKDEVDRFGSELHGLATIALGVLDEHEQRFTLVVVLEDHFASPVFSTRPEGREDRRKVPLLEKEVLVDGDVQLPYAAVEAVEAADSTCLRRGRGLLDLVEEPSQRSMVRHDAGGDLGEVQRSFLRVRAPIAV
jgi:hypothetical protein